VEEIAMRSSLLAILVLLLLASPSWARTYSPHHVGPPHHVHRVHLPPPAPVDQGHFPEDPSEARVFQIPDDVTTPEGHPPPEVKQAEPAANPLEPNKAASNPASPASSADCNKDPSNPLCYTATIQARPAVTR